MNHAEQHRILCWDCVRVALFAVLLPRAAGGASCGLENQGPCADELCSGQALPEEAREPGYYPRSSHFVPAPAGYRVPKGQCTRCGNLFEPACEDDEGLRGVCFGGYYSVLRLQASNGGFCVPTGDLFGCGTDGKPPCPDDMATAFGVPVVVGWVGGAGTDADSWSRTAALKQRDDGCLYSELFPHLRFVRAARKDLPEPHGCAEVCVPCGHVGEVACPDEPACTRRRDRQEHSAYLDGPVAVKDGRCEELNCGAETVAGRLPTCDGSELPRQLGGPDGDGCMAPYSATDDLDDTRRVCAAPESSSPSQPPYIHSVLEGTACGLEGALACDGLGFGGCGVAEGLVNDDSGTCVPSDCGWSTSSDETASVPCTPGDPVVPGLLHAHQETGCLHFHDKKGEGGQDGLAVCKPCGAPGSLCRDECLHVLVWESGAALDREAGQFRLALDYTHATPCPVLRAAAFDGGACETVDLPAVTRPPQLMQRECDGSSTAALHEECFSKSLDKPKCCEGYSQCVQEASTFSCQLPMELFQPCDGPDGSSRCWKGMRCVATAAGQRCVPEDLLDGATPTTRMSVVGILGLATAGAGVAVVAGYGMGMRRQKDRFSHAVTMRGLDRTWGSCPGGMTGTTRIWRNNIFAATGHDKHRSIDLSQTISDYLRVNPVPDNSMSLFATGSPMIGVAPRGFDALVSDAGGVPPRFPEGSDGHDNQ